MPEAYTEEEIQECARFVSKSLNDEVVALTGVTLFTLPCLCCSSHYVEAAGIIK